MQHLEQQARAAAGRITLLVGRHVARTHHTLVAVTPTASANTDAAARRFGEAPAVVAMVEIASDFRRLVGRSLAQVGGDRERVDDLAGIHPPIWIPD